MLGTFDEKGFSTVEAIVASAIAVLVLLATTSAFRVAGNVQAPGTEQLSSAGQGIETNALIAPLLMGHWKSLSKNACKTNGDEAPVADGMDHPDFGIELLDGKALKEVLPKKLSDNSDNPLRKAIDLLLATHGNGAAEKCADSSLAADPELSVIANSAGNQALCRCATARTVYDSFAPAKDDVSSSHSAYACWIRRQKGEKVVVEAAGMLLNPLSDSVASCLDVDAVASGLGRVDYQIAKLGSDKSISGTFYVGDGGGK